MKSLLAATALVAALSSTARAGDKLPLFVGGADVVGAAVFAGGLQMDLSRLKFATSLAGVGIMGLAAPIAFAADEHYGYMAIGLGARVLLPTVGLVAGFQIGSVSRSDTVLTSPPVVGFLVGFLAVSIIDVVMAVQTIHEDDPTATPRMISIGGHF